MKYCFMLTFCFLVLLSRVYGQGSDNIWCPNGIPTWGATDSFAALPLICYDTSIAHNPAPGAIVNVNASDATDFQNKLTAAVCGQIIQLTGSYLGTFTVPARSCSVNNNIYVRTSGIASLPPEGTRISPCYAGVLSLPGRPPFNCPVIPGNYMAKLITPNTTCPLAFTAGGTSGWRFIGLEITRTSGTGLMQQMVCLGDIGNIDHVIFDRDWIHAVETDETKRGIHTNAASYIAVVGSYFNSFVCIQGIGTCTDSHAFSGGTNLTNSVTEIGLKAVDNFFEAAGEPFFFGGGASNTTPSDIEDRLNTEFKPLIWNPGDASYNGGVSGHPFCVKNLLELKNVRRILVESNKMFNNWAGCSQNGGAILITATNQGGTCPNCLVDDVTIRYSTVNSVASFGQISMTDTNGGSVLAAEQNHISIHDIIVDNVLPLNCYQCIATSSIIQTVAHDLDTLTQVLHHVSINHITVVPAASGIGTPLAALGISGPTIASGNNIHDYFFTNSLIQSGTRGATNTLGAGQPLNCANGMNTASAVINSCWTNYTLAGNCFVVNGSIVWPGSNVTSVASFAAVFVNYNNGNGGDYRLSANACRLQALDGSDPGANIAIVASVLAGNLPPSSITFYAWAVPRSLPSSCNPQVAGSPFWCEHAQYVQPRFSGITVLLLGTDIDLGTTTCPVTSVFDATAWNAFDARWTTSVPITGGGSYPAYNAKAVNFVLSHISTSGSPKSNTATPPYVFTQECANQAAPLWVAGKTYYSGDVVCYPSGSCGTQSGGHYYQTTISGLCVASGATGPPGDAACAPWVDKGATVPPLQSTFGNSYPGTAVGTCVLPSNTVADINTVNGCGSLADKLATLATGVPIVWQPAFQSWMKQFDAAVIAHYQAVSWENKISYLRIGAVAGGEAFPWNASLMRSVLTPTTTAQLKTVFQQHVATIVSYAESQRVAAGATFHIMYGVNGGINAINTCDWADAEAATIVANNGWIGSESLTSSDVTNYAIGPQCFSQPPPGGSNDWPFIFATYPSTGVLQTQLAGPSCPTGGTCSGTQSSGPLNTTLPFLLQRSQACINSGTCNPVHELFEPDALCAYDPLYVGDGSSYLSTYTQCQAAGYPAVIENNFQSGPTSLKITLGTVLTKGMTITP